MQPLRYLLRNRKSEVMHIRHKLFRIIILTALIHFVTPSVEAAVVYSGAVSIDAFTSDGYYAYTFDPLNPTNGYYSAFGDFGNPPPVSLTNFISIFTSDFALSGDGARDGIFGTWEILETTNGPLRLFFNDPIDATGSWTSEKFGLNNSLAVDEIGYFGIRETNLNYYGWVEIERVTNSNWRILGVAINTEGEFTAGLTSLGGDPTSAIPEPGTMVLLAFGLGGAGLLRRRLHSSQTVSPAFRASMSAARRPDRFASSDIYS
jgi:hypothetical protein